MGLYSILTRAWPGCASNARLKMHDNACREKATFVISQRFRPQDANLLQVPGYPFGLHQELPLDYLCCTAARPRQSAFPCRVTLLTTKVVTSLAPVLHDPE